MLSTINYEVMNHFISYCIHFFIYKLSFVKILQYADYFLIDVYFLSDDRIGGDGVGQGMSELNPGNPPSCPYCTRTPHCWSLRILIYFKLLLPPIVTSYLIIISTSSHCPALMNELHKLRTDNSDLLKKIDASSIDSLNLMESQIADQKCVNTSLQVYYLHVLLLP